MNLDRLPTTLGINELRQLGLTAEDVRSLDPPPTERTGHDGQPCWDRDELADLLDRKGGAH